MTGRISMSQRELKRYSVIAQLIKKLINGTTAAELLKLSVRQVKRLKAAVLESGAKGLIHGNRGQTSNHRIDRREKEKIVLLLHKHYPDFGPTFAAEKLDELHDIKHDSKTIRAIMIEEKLWKTRPLKSASDHRSWRERKHCIGEMQQFDGSYEYWFEDRSSKCCLLAAIDDASGIVTHAKFVQDEGVMPVFGFWQEYLLLHGKPMAIYTDKFSTYKMNHKQAMENYDQKTQFQRAMSELQIEPIFANSPEAKGRVERLFGVLQDRLIKELRLAKINNIEDANRFLKKYLVKFNRQFGVEPKNKINLHRTLSEKETRILGGILSRQTKRVVQNDFTISFQSRWYQLTKDQPVTIGKHDQVIVEERTNGDIQIRFGGKYLNYERLPEYAKKPRRVEQNMWVIAATAPAIQAVKTIH